MQLAVFPMDIINVTQGEGGSYSHQGKLAIDFVGTHPKYPYYAPFDCTCTMHLPNEALLQWVSDDVVMCVDGIPRRIIFWAIHECNPVHSYGSKVKKGQLLGHTGVCGRVTGDHVHFEVWEYSNGGRGTPLHMYNVFSVPKSVKIINGGGYNWRESGYNDGTSPPSIREDYFYIYKPFVRRRR